MNAVSQTPDNPFASAAVATRQAAPRDFPAMLTAWLPEIQRALPKHLSAERIARIALTAFRRNPMLGQCEPKSVFAAVIQSSQLGLEVDMLGRAYLVPYKKSTKTAEGWKKTVECQFIPGWKGLVDLMNRSGQGTVWTGAVYEGDEFDWQLGDNPFVHHKPMGEDDPSKLTHVYAIGRVKGADYPVIEVWPIAKIWRHRDRYNKVGESHYSFENQEMYARKVPLLQVLKYMPCSAELQTAMALNDAAETTGQNLSVKEAIEGTWAPTPEGEPQEVDTDKMVEAGKQDLERRSNSSSALREAATRAAPAKSVDDIPVTIEHLIDDIKNATSAEMAQISLDKAKRFPDADYESAIAAYRDKWGGKK